MKIRYLVIALIIVLSISLAGCNKAAKSAPATSEPAAQTTQNTNTAPANNQEAAAKQPSAPEENSADQEEKVVEVPETEMGPGIVTDEDIETGEYTQHSLLGAPQNADASMARDLSAEPERFSNFDCKKDEETGIRYISIKVTNTNSDEHFMISPKGVAKGYNTYFMVRGMVDKDPGCAVEDLAPGESTVCDKIGLDDERYGNPEGTNRITIQSPDNDGKYVSEAVVVNCPA